MDRVFVAPVWVWILFTLYFAAVGFGVGYAVASLRRPPPPYTASRRTQTTLIDGRKWPPETSVDNAPPLSWNP